MHRWFSAGSCVAFAGKAGLSRHPRTKGCTFCRRACEWKLISAHDEGVRQCDCGQIWAHQSGARTPGCPQTQGLHLIKAIKGYVEFTPQRVLSSTSATGQSDDRGRRWHRKWKPRCNFAAACVARHGRLFRLQFHTTSQGWPWLHGQLRGLALQRNALGK